MDPSLDTFQAALTNLLTLVATLVIGVIGNHVRQLLKEKVAQKYRDVVLPGLSKALDYGSSLVVEGRVPTKEEVIAAATTYSFKNFGTALEKLGLDPESVREMLIARYGTPPVADAAPAKIK